MDQRQQGFLKDIHLHAQISRKFLERLSIVPWQTNFSQVAARLIVRRKDHESARCVVPGNILIGFVALGSGQAQDVQNLLANGGFEDGVMAPWNTYGSVTSEVVQGLVGVNVLESPVEGQSCPHVTVSAAGANFWDLGLWHAGHVFEKDKKYTLAAWYKVAEGELNVNVKPELGQNPWTGYGVQAFTMTEEWQEFSVTTPYSPRM